MKCCFKFNVITCTSTLTHVNLRQVLFYSPVQQKIKSYITANLSEQVTSLL